MIILPLPPLMLDILFTFNISLSILVLLRCANVTSILQFSVFPTLLLLSTVLRLSLNVASTRAVLGNGHEGTDAAGRVVEAFGTVIVGGSYIVGAISFIIICIISFMVVTKGSERIAQVGARFSLDALPVRLMAIETASQNGQIDEEEATRRRENVLKESDLSGSFDGVAAYVKGDAIAGMAIMVINLIGGVGIGTIEHGMGASEAFKTFALLTIGDGLVAQIPSLLLAIAAGVLVSRISDGKTDLSETLLNQITGDRSIFFLSGGIMLAIAIIPGMPHLAFVTFALLLLTIGWFLADSDTQKQTVAPANTEAVEVRGNLQPLDWSVIPSINPVSLELGLKLVKLTTEEINQPLQRSIMGCRKTLSELVGFLIPEVAIRSSYLLKNNEYSIHIDGNLIAKGQVFPDHLMVVGIPPGDLSLDGIRGFDPAMNLPALWIEPDQRSAAVAKGFSVIAVHDVIATHISKVCREYLPLIFNFDDVKALNERLHQDHPELAETLGKSITPNLQMQVIRQLLTDQIPVKNVRTIANTLIESAEKTKDPIILASDIRLALSRTIMALISPLDKLLNVYTISKELTDKVHLYINNAKGIDPNTPLDAIPIDEDFQTSMMAKMPSMLQNMRAQRLPAILLVPNVMRPLFSKLARTYAPGLIVLSFNEIPVDYKINEVEKI
ncbi:FHIPEP family type III secretion protein [Vibrio breoganii]|nr:flagellar biosynthesis protein FlhA [Vibrio breoganii]